MTAWATSETVLADGGVEQVMSRSVEIHTAATVHFAGVSAADFAAAVGELEGRLPGKRTESILVTMQQFRRKGS